MIDEIHFDQYRKLKDITLKFSKSLNVISGTNGTCKSTLMHVISNSFQSVKRSDDRYKSSEAINLLNKFVDKVNPKIESVSRGDKKAFQNPAEGRPGTLFTVSYTDGTQIGFRRHNSTDESKLSNFRFAIKPRYTAGTSDRLPAVPIVYLGLSRLFPYGELSDTHEFVRPRGQLPAHIHEAFVRQYKDLTRIEIVQALNQDVPNVKKRSDFTTTTPGVDSNTISSGEDNIGIILTALNCLRNLAENVVEGREREIESILLIDEIDATLHPSLQKKLFNLIDEYSTNYRIQVFFTTHSLYLLKHAYGFRPSGRRISYLVDQVHDVSLMADPSPIEIELHLDGLLGKDLYKKIHIPVYTEDAEARLFLGYLFDYISEKVDPSFALAKDYLHLVEVNIGAESLRNLFGDRIVDQSSMRAICILDGDATPDLAKHIIALPGNASPETVFASYAKELMKPSAGRGFWDAVLGEGYSRMVARDIVDEYDGIAARISDTERSGNPTKGMRRELNKAHFVKHKRFYELVMRHWLQGDAQKGVIQRFRDDLHKVFMKTAAYYSLDRRAWPVVQAS